jgi:Cytochrome oxidase complex assembly protein 1
MTTDYTKPYEPPQPPRMQSPPPPKSGGGSGCLKGALIGCGVLILLGAAGVAGLVVFVFGAIKSTHVYTEAVRRAQSNPQVIARLGTPIEPGWWVSGNVNIHNDSGTAQISIPIHGPKVSATIHADAIEENSSWKFTRLVVEGGGPPIDLAQ